MIDELAKIGGVIIAVAAQFSGSYDVWYFTATFNTSPNVWSTQGSVNWGGGMPAVTHNPGVIQFVLLWFNGPCESYSSLNPLYSR